MCQFFLFLHSLSNFSTQFLKNRSGMLYFSSRLYNRICIFITFYRGWIHRGWTTALVSHIQPRLNVFFLLVSLLHVLFFTPSQFLFALILLRDFVSMHNCLVPICFMFLKNEYGKKVLRKKMALNVLRVFAWESPFLICMFQ